MGARVHQQAEIKTTAGKREEIRATRRVGRFMRTRRAHATANEQYELRVKQTGTKFEGENARMENGPEQVKRKKLEERKREKADKVHACNMGHE